MDIGLFQLENITLAFMPFVYFDVRTERSPVHPELDALLARAEGVAADAVPERMNELGVPKTMPIVLVCEDGRGSGRLRTDLDRLGYTQIYVVEDGVAGLLRDVDL